MKININKKEYYVLMAGLCALKITSARFDIKELWKLQEKLMRSREKKT